MVFFARHPRTLLPSESLGSLLGYELKEIARSLEALLECGLLKRAQTSAHAARLYVLPPRHHDGRDALDVLQNEEVDIIFCDLRMPNMDGYEFIRALRHRGDGPQPPVIAISGQASSGDHRRTHAAGFDGHIDKPFIDTDLLSAVSAVRARRRAN